MTKPYPSIVRFWPPRNEDVTCEAVGVEGKLTVMVTGVAYPFGLRA